MFFRNVTVGRLWGEKRIREKGCYGLVFGFLKEDSFSIALLKSAHSDGKICNAIEKPYMVHASLEYSSEDFKDG